MTRSRLFFLLLLLGAAGCAASNYQYVPGPDHPARSDARGTTYLMDRNVLAAEWEPDFGESDEMSGHDMDGMHMMHGPASQPTTQPATGSTTQPATQPASQPATRPASQPATRPAMPMEHMMDDERHEMEDENEEEQP